MTTPDLDARAAAARQFALTALQAADESAYGFASASADASFRRYFRLSHGTDSWVVMDAPPEQENCLPFIQVADLMRDAGLNAPRVLAEDLANGYLLLSDLGRQTFLNVLTDDNADKLFADAISALISWQQSTRKGVLPVYDEALLARELALFPDWYVARHLGRTLSAEQKVWWDESCGVLIASALAQTKVFVHRDYMPRNLMVSKPSPGILDFQDAVLGPITYDVVSLFKDAFRSWPEARVQAWAKQYWTKARAAGLPVRGDTAQFQRDFDLMGVQRHLKVLGIFARINYRDGKPHYLADTPRFIGYVRSVATCYADLAPLVKLFDSLDLRA